MQCFRSQQKERVCFCTMEDYCYDVVHLISSKYLSRSRKLSPLSLLFCCSMAFSLFIFASTICVQLRCKKRKTFLKADFMIRLFNHIVKPKSTKRENGQTAINNISESHNSSRSRSSCLNSLLPVGNSNLLFLSG